MAYIALYRAYRPQTFNEVAGQKPIIQTLKNAIKLNKVAHAYLFAGPRGTGKTTMAKIMAKALNCEHGPTDDPCNECEICQGITKGTIADVIEIDAASNNGVDEIRELRDNVKYLPSVCKYKVYIIDEVHMLSQGAFNALLKTLEEPPAHVVFILATTEPNKIPLTILSRCQRFDFQAISETDMVERLKDVISKENLSVTDEALHLVASLSEGGMRDALSLLDQSISYSKDQNITVDDILAVSGNVSDKYILELLKKIKENEASNALDILNKVLDSGKEISKVISDIMFFLRNVLLFKINKIESTKEIYKDSDYITYANAIDNSLIYKYLNLLNETLNNIKYTNQKRAFLEICIIKMADNQKTQDINSLLRRIDQLERKVERLSMLKSNNTEPVFPDQDYNLPSYEEIDHSNITYDNSKCIEVGEINDIINNGDKNIRNNVISILPQLIDINPLLQDVKCVCTSKESAIFTLDSEGMSNRMMKDPMYTEVLEFFKKDFDFKNVYFINQSMWDELLADWMDKYKAGNKSPILDNHDIRILKYVKENDENINSKDSIDELFDEDLIKEE
jgi:DNA polymerase-3 subunit gamma/tau